MFQLPGIILAMLTVPVINQSINHIIIMYHYHAYIAL